MTVSQVPIAQGPELFRRTLNAILTTIQNDIATLQASAVRSGASLPVSATPDQSLFVLTTTNQLYQARSGTWHAVSGSWS